MAYASVNSVYQAAKVLAAKQQQGFASPTEVNVLLPLVQRKVFATIMGRMQLIAESRRTYRDNAHQDFGTLQQWRDMVRGLRKSATPTGANPFTLPADYFTMEVEGGAQATSSAGTWPVTIVTKPEAMRMNRSGLSAPSATGPVGYIQDNLFTLLPSTLTTGALSIDYYKQPEGTTSADAHTTQLPMWGYTEVSGVAVYNPSTTINFELDKSAENMLTLELLSQIGINLREEELLSYTKREQQESVANGS